MATFSNLVAVLLAWLGFATVGLGQGMGDALVLRSSDGVVQWPVAGVTSAPIGLNLSQAQRLALTQHSTALGAALDVPVQGLQRQVGENDLRPKFTFSGQAARQLPGSLSGAGSTGSVLVGSTLKLASSTQLELGLTQTHNAVDGGMSSQPLTQVVQLVQPLLKNGGFAQANAVRDLARFNDAIASYQREQVLDGLYTSVTLAYLDALQARQQVAVAERARASVMSSREVNVALHEAGRIAKLDLLQFEADLSQADLNLAQARNAAAAAVSRLLQWLGPATAENFPDDVALDESNLSLAAAVHPDSLQAVLQQRKDWQIAQAGLDVARLGTVLAKNETLPQLDLVLGVQNTTGVAAGLKEGNDYSAGVRFSVPLDFTLMRLQNAQATVNEQKLVLAAVDLRRQIADEVTNSARDIAFAKRQFVLSEATVEFNQQKLTAEREKFRAGRSSAFQLSSAQDALNSAEVARVQAQFGVYRAGLEHARSSGALQQLRAQVLP